MVTGGKGWSEYYPFKIELTYDPPQEVVPLPSETLSLTLHHPDSNHMTGNRPASNSVMNIHYVNFCNENT